MVGDKKVGLALSGGGYRAAAFHLGTLRMLQELGILQKLDVMSTISGGSIIGAYYCLHEQSFEDFDRVFSEKLNASSVIKRVLGSADFLCVIATIFLFLILFVLSALYITSWLLIGIIPVFFYLISRFQFRFFPVSREIEKVYDEFFFDGKTLSQLKDNPELAIVSTSLQTCRPFTFSRRKMDDSGYAYRNPPVSFEHKAFPIARAVAASTCVPSFFSPIVIDPKFIKATGSVDDVHPVLVDGGIYDNQGIQKLTQKGSSYACEIIITSDAGNKLPFKGSYNNTFVLLLRTMEAFMARIKNFQMAQQLYGGPGRTTEVAYFSLGWDLKGCIPGFIKSMIDKNIPEGVADLHGISTHQQEDPAGHRTEITEILIRNTNYDKILANDLTEEELAIAHNVKTNLTPLTQIQLHCLAKHAANLTELQVRLYCPTLFR